MDMIYDGSVIAIAISDIAVICYMYIALIYRYNIYVYLYIPAHIDT
jgi:hypothetical protein